MVRAHLARCQGPGKEAEAKSTTRNVEEEDAPSRASNATEKCMGDVNMKKNSAAAKANTARKQKRIMTAIGRQWLGGK